MGFKKVKRKDSFAQWFIDNYGEDKFEKIINHEKNIKMGLDIWTISKRSMAKIWFKCENKDYHEYCLPADNYCKGNRCRYCGRTKYVHPKDSFGQYIIDNYGKDFINTIWSDKNEKSAFKYSLGTEKKIWLKCINGIHNDTFRQVKNAVRSDLRCPLCSVTKTSSVLVEKVINYLKEERKYNVLSENSCNIVATNPKTNYKLPYDIEVVKLKLIIEVHGRQHYDLIGQSSKWLHGKPPKQYLHDRKLIDRYKRIFAKSQGFFYLEIPYWAEENDLYKTLINNKIIEILSP